MVRGLPLITSYVMKRKEKSNCFSNNGRDWSFGEGYEKSNIITPTRLLVEQVVKLHVDRCVPAGCPNKGTDASN